MLVHHAICTNVSDEKQFSLQLHLVHYSSVFASLTEAAAVPNALMVLGIMIEVS